MGAVNSQPSNFSYTHISTVSKKLTLTFIQIPFDQNRDFKRFIVKIVFEFLPGRNIFLLIIYEPIVIPSFRRGIPQQAVIGLCQTKSISVLIHIRLFLYWLKRPVLISEFHFRHQTQRSVRRFRRMNTRSKNGISFFGFNYS